MPSPLARVPTLVAAVTVQVMAASFVVGALTSQPATAQTAQEKEKEKQKALRKKAPPPGAQPKAAAPAPQKKFIAPGAKAVPPPPRAVAPRTPPPRPPVATVPPRTPPPRAVAPKVVPPPRQPVLTAPKRFDPPKTVTPKVVPPPPRQPVLTAPKRFDPPKTVAPKVVPPPPRQPVLTAPKRFDPPKTATPNVAPPPPGKPGLVVPKVGTVPPASVVAPKTFTKQPAPVSPTTKLVPPGAKTTVRPIAGPRTFDQIRKARVETKTKSGATQIKEPGNRTIIKQGGRTIITRNESTTFRALAPAAKSTRRGDGVTETVFVRPDGTRVVSETDRNGRLLRRYRRAPDGRIVTLVDNRRFLRKVGIGLGVAALATIAVVALAPPSHAVPRRQYIVDYADASEDDIYAAMTAPPVERLERTYSLDEIRYSPSLRDRVRRVDLDNINFDFGSFEITPDQYPKLERMARVLHRAIEANPGEVFLIEGHTDAVGSEEDNLSLSDRRAESVAQILVEHFEIPMENLVTQGYGEQQLKVPTQEAERANRRVTMRRITPLLSQQDQEQR
ncbi:MAG: OmpA family protein [Hyphomicrobiaceae bacterium]